MPKRTRAYHEFLIEQLTDPVFASEYLNEARNESQKIFLKALRNVAEAHRMAIVAADAGVNRETLYRTLSEEGNPRLDTYESVLDALGIDYVFQPKQTVVAEPTPNVPANALEPETMTIRTPSTNIGLSANTFMNSGGGNIDILVTNGAEAEQQDLPDILPYFAARELERMESMSEYA